MSPVSPTKEDAAEVFLRSIVPPEEDRRRYTSAPWAGGFRWFRSINVIPIEQLRRRRPRGDSGPSSNAA